MERTHYKQEINMTEALMSRINELISHYPEDKRKSALSPVLHEVQDAHENWLSYELMDKVAEILHILWVGIPSIQLPSTTAVQPYIGIPFFTAVISLLL